MSSRSAIITRPWQRSRIMVWPWRRGLVRSRAGARSASKSPQALPAGASARVSWPLVWVERDIAVLLRSGLCGVRQGLQSVLHVLQAGAPGHDRALIFDLDAAFEEAALDERRRAVG